MKKAFSVTLALILVSLGYACSGTASIPTKVAVPAGTLFFDDFSNTNGDWSLIQGADGTAGYFEGHYRISVLSNNAQIIANPGKNFPGDVIIQVDEQNSGGGATNYTGVVCHYQDANNYYMFLITSDGNWGFS